MIKNKHLTPYDDKIFAENLMLMQKVWKGIVAQIIKLDVLDKKENISGESVQRMIDALITARTYLIKISVSHFIDEVSTEIIRQLEEGDHPLKDTVTKRSVKNLLMKKYSEIKNCVGFDM